MYTIKMNAHKQLIATEMMNIYQREKLVDRFQILIPAVYDDYDMTLFTYVLKYMDTANVVHSEVLTADEELYKEDWIRFELPIDTELTRFAGNMGLYITATMIADGDQYVMNTAPITVTVQPLSNLYDMIPDAALDAIDQRIGQLNATAAALDIMAQSISEDMVDDLAMDDDDRLHVTAKGKMKGEGVEMYRVKNEPDGKNDGVIIIDEDGDDPEPTPPTPTTTTYRFIEI